jgi:HEAT repeat protein
MSAEQLLTELLQTVTNLLHAGAETAITDGRLSQLVPSLRRLGAKVPVLARLADATGRVPAAGAEAPRALLDLLLLARQARQALLTAGSLKGTLRPLPVSEAWQTPLSGVEAADLADSLIRRPPKGLAALGTATQKSGGLDLRLLQPALDPLADRHGKTDQFGRKLPPLPEWARPLAPALALALDLNGGEREARRLDLLLQLDPELGAQRCQDAVRQGSKEVRRVALAHLASGPVPAGLLPALVQLFAYPEFLVSADAADAAAQAGLAALPVLLPLIGGEAGSWWRATDALCQLVDPDTSPVAAQAAAALRGQVPLLLETLDRTDYVTLECQLRLLRVLAPGDPGVRRRVVELLRPEATGPDRRTGWPGGRRLLIEYLVEQGIPDEEALDLIAAVARNDTNDGARKAAALGLAGLAPDWPRALPRLFELLGSDRQETLQAALSAIQEVGPAAAPAAPVLIELARRGDKRVRHAVLPVLRFLGSAVPGVVETLLAALADRDADVRWSASWQLCHFDSRTPGIVPAFGKLVRKGSPQVRNRVLEVLATMRPPTPDMLALFREASTHAEAGVRSRALAGLRPFGGTVAEVLPALVAGLGDAAPQVRRSAARELGRLRPVTATAVTALRKALQDRDPEVPPQAALSLGWIGPASASALPGLRKLAAKHPQDKIYRKAIQRIEDAS